MYTHTHNTLCMFLYITLCLKPVKHHRVYASLLCSVSLTPFWNSEKLSPLPSVHLLIRSTFPVGKQSHRWVRPEVSTKAWPFSSTSMCLFKACKSKAPLKKGRKNKGKAHQRAQPWTWTLPIWSAIPWPGPRHLQALKSQLPIKEENLEKSLIII